MSTAMQKAGPSSGLAPIRTPDEFRTALATYQREHYNLVCPIADVATLPERHVLVPTVVLIDANPEGGEVYRDPLWCKDGELAPGKVALRKIAQCAGIIISTERTDPRTIPNYWEFKATVKWRGLDGGLEQREAHKDWDMRQGSPQIKGSMSPKQIEAMRANGLRHCEARAINAAIREYGVKQKYTTRELQKPFVVLRLMYQPDMNNPIDRAAVVNSNIGSTQQLYPGAPAPSDAIDAEVVNREPVSAGGSSTAAGSSDAPKPQAAVDPNAPPSPNAVKVKKVEGPFTGTVSGRPWERHDVIFSNGTQVSLFLDTEEDRQMLTACKKFEQSQAWVDYSSEKKGRYENLTEIGPAQPSLLDRGDERY